MAGSQSGLDPLSQKIAVELTATSNNGCPNEILAIAPIQETLGLEQDEIDAAMLVLEQRGFVEQRRWEGDRGVREVRPTWRLFFEFDPPSMRTCPKLDAVHIARLLVMGEGPFLCERLANDLNWPARRFNPASGYLAETGEALLSREVGAHPFAYLWICATETTPSFVASNNQ